MTYFFNSVIRDYCCRASDVTLSFVDTLIALTYLLTYLQTCIYHAVT